VYLVCDLYPVLGNQNFEQLGLDTELFKINDLKLSSKTMYVLFGAEFRCRRGEKDTGKRSAKSESLRLSFS
jgi:hypothetical protein